MFTVISCMFFDGKLFQMPELEHSRMLRAISGSNKFSGLKDLGIFYGQELRTQQALSDLGINITDSPEKAPKVDRIFMNIEGVESLRRPYAIEVMGPPGSGKTTVINKYLEYLWYQNKRHTVAYIEEGVRDLPKEANHIQASDPVFYSILGSLNTTYSYMSALKELPNNTYAFLTDRGFVEKRVWRRAYFSKGDVDPKPMATWEENIDQAEGTPIQVGAIIMLMMRPEFSMYARGNDGTPRRVRNMDLLPRLYEQYWRLHWEILNGQIPYRVYICINAERSLNEVYEEFSNAMDLALNMQEIYKSALAKAFPKEYGQALKQIKHTPKEPSYAKRILSKQLGGSVKIIGGDDMGSENDILKRPFIEVVRTRKT